MKIRKYTNFIKTEKTLDYENKGYIDIILTPMFLVMNFSVEDVESYGYYKRFGALVKSKGKAAMGAINEDDDYIGNAVEVISTLSSILKESDGEQNEGLFITG
jgi:hypothetical protein